MKRKFRLFLILLRRFRNQLFTQGLVLTAWAAVDWIYRAITGHPIRRFSEINPQIFLGGQPTEKFFPTLIDWDVTGIVNMRSEFDYAVQLEGIFLKYLHLPTEDDEAPSLIHLQTGVDFIREIIGEGGAVYIHCWEGLGRGPTMVAAYFVSTGLDVKTAWEKIHKVRPFIRPTPIQVSRLIEFAATYTKPENVPENLPTIVVKVENSPIAEPIENPNQGA